ncbi:hypothetical protein Poli38472_011201 [Pythium oligandrum]|uniref:EF-hand domain-containing protein n=1 Tax=Pythium oligandrum TaxID=41045 RepID=A0A8K1CPT0_PYTOL|nr:hypothetical protein Poli38472_011201 [Pythium oligandrum]|eukprot:TMW67581.1 hypothetical protein Poli38472_011201 [Pythium oligandrum]
MSKIGSPQNDLTVPLNDTRQSVDSGASPRNSRNSRVRKSTAGSDDLNEKISKMKIDMDSNKKGALKQERWSPEFRFNAEMSLRVAFGVIIASFVQTRNPDYDSTAKHDNKWFIFPDWYYLGGLSYCAVAVIFSAGKSVGATIREVCQSFYGVGLALIYNIILFAIIDLHMYEGSYDGYELIEKSFNASPYRINTHNFFVVLPWMMLFTVVVLLLPIENNTKKFALGNNLYFSLTIINPTNPLDSSKLKGVGDDYFSTANVLKNLEMYFLVGFAGTLISLLIMFIPYPVFAINRLRKESLKASDDILDLLNIIVDSYCFKNKNVEHMNFLKLKLHRKFGAAEARYQRMNQLIDDVWWEQLFGFNKILKFNRSMIKNYVRLVGSLIADLRSLNNAMQLEKYAHLHFEYMKALQRHVYLIQMQSGDLLEEISLGVHDCEPLLDLKWLKPLEAQMETTLQMYQRTQSRILRKQNVTLKDIEGNVPLNLFLFSLNSFCSTLIDFQESHNAKIYDTTKRAQSFIATSIKAFFVCHKFTRLHYLGALRASLAIFAGIFLAVYVYAFSNTTPAAVAYVMSNHIGGSFSVTVNRVGGVVAGSVVPSVFQFFISQVCSPKHLNTFLTDLTLFAWVAISMYVRFSGGYGSYAGLVSAFIAAGILLKQSDVCGADGTAALAISSYSTMAQTSVGVLLFIIVELALCPQSAQSLLRLNIQETLNTLQKSFDILFVHHLSSTDELDEKTLKEVRDILQVKVPALLVAQSKLLNEANAEPALWKPAFSYQKYEKILDNCYRLLNNNNLLFKLVRWFNYRVKNDKVDLSKSVDIRNTDDGPSGTGSGAVKEDLLRQKWQAASYKFHTSVGDTFDTLEMLFGDGFLYADPDQTAIFMQMKEAFRLADTDCSGEIDADEVAVLLENIFAQSGAVKEEEIHKYVEEFMAIVDDDNSGKVSFEEFMNALENGLKLEVEVYHRRKPKAPVLQRQPTMSRTSALSRISEESGAEPPLRVSIQTVPSPSKAKASAFTPKALALTPKRPIVQKRMSTVSAGLNSPMMRRQHDVLNVEDFSLGEIAGTMKSAYVEWLMGDRRYEKVTMEELLLLNCLVSGAEGIARNLTTIEEIVVSS